MSSPANDPTIELAERVATIAAELGIQTAVIGAMALAAHNYVRGTADIDLALSVDPFRELASLEKRLRAEGYHTELNLPDADDALGGVLRVRARAEDDDLVELVNFQNPLNPSKNPGLEAIRTASPIASSVSLRCATLAHVIALKLYAGGRRDHVDVVEVLRQNPSADVAQIRDVCTRYGLGDALEELLREVV